MTSHRLVSAGTVAIVMAAGAGAGLALSGAGTPVRGPLVLVLLAVVPAVAIAGLLRNLDPFARLIIAVTATIGLDYLVAEVMLATDAWSPTRGLIAVLVIVAACFALQLPAVRIRLRASLRTSQTRVQRLAVSAGALLAALPAPLPRGAAGWKTRPRWMVAAVAAASVALAFVPLAPHAHRHRPAIVRHGQATVGHAPAVSPGAPRISVGPPPHRPQAGPPAPAQHQARQHQPGQRAARRHRPGRPSAARIAPLPAGHRTAPAHSGSPAPAPRTSATPPSTAPSPSPGSPSPSGRPSPSSSRSPSPSPSKSHRGCVVVLGVRVCL